MLLPVLFNDSATAPQETQQQLQKFILQRSPGFQRHLMTPFELFIQQISQEKPCKTTKSKSPGDAPPLAAHPFLRLPRTASRM